jgi:glycosyltransferase involved in cell wall biosynthesis
VRLGIDASNLRLGGGITHVVELLRAADPGRFGFSEVVVWGRRALLERIEERSWLIKTEPPGLDRGLLYQAYWQRFRLSELARQAGCDLLFVPGGSYVGRFSPVVTMSQNMLPFEWRETRRYGCSKYTLKWILLRLVQSRSFRNADGVIFLTGYARSAVLRLLGPLRGKAVTIPHGVNPRFMLAPRPQRAADDFSVSRPCRLLYVSTTEFYKHQWNVAQAVARLRSEGVPVSLDLVGPPGRGQRRLDATLARVDPARAFITNRGEIAYEELHRVYAVADMGVFASSCENLPNILVEGMAGGLPMACSNLGPMPEVLGDAGVYFNPERVDEIAAAIRSLVQSAALRSQKAAAGFARAQQYCWKRCADETFAFLAELARPRAVVKQPRAARLSRG